MWIPTKKLACSGWPVELGHVYVHKHKICLQWSYSLKRFRSRRCLTAKPETCSSTEHRTSGSPREDAVVHDKHPVCLAIGWRVWDRAQLTKKKMRRTVVLSTIYLVFLAIALASIDAIASTHDLAHPDNVLAV